MKIIIAPDSFKGTLSAQEFCSVAAEKIKEQQLDAEIISMPLADGGEGTLDCVNAALSGKIQQLEVTGPFINQSVTARIGFFEEGKTAVIESAMAMGLPLVGDRKNPEITTTYGVGQMIDFAITKGADRILLALGGSSTNDCGAGMLCALGAKFYNKENQSFIPTGGTLKEVVSADFSLLAEKTKNITFTAMCDVTNPLCGEKGCSEVFAPQKGADRQMVLRLDAACKAFSEVIQKKLGKNNKENKNFAEIPGSGAAGGLGFACVSVLHGNLKSGIETILQLYKFVQNLQNCDYIFTGEGRFDSQSLMGKTIGGIINANRNTQIPVVIFCGKNTVEDGDNGENYHNNLHTVHSIVEISKGYETDYALTHAPELLGEAIKQWLKEN